jgi:hypothetical protein
VLSLVSAVTFVMVTLVMGRRLMLEVWNRKWPYKRKTLLYRSIGQEDRLSVGIGSDMVRVVLKG